MTEPTEREQAYWNRLRWERWNRRLDQYQTGSPQKPLILNEAMISQWLRNHRAEYNSATETVKAWLLQIMSLCLYVFHKSA